MRVALLTHYWPPEVGAPQTRLLETVRQFLDKGDQVRVVTNHPHYPDGRVRDGFHPLTIRRESIEGFSVLRLPVLARPNRGMLNRVVDQASFAATASAAISVARWADVLLVESPPLFMGLTARFLRAVTGVPYVFHVADPWPDYPIAVGALRGSLPVRLARWMERTAYEGAAVITTPTQGCERLINAQPGTAGKVRVIPNGVDISRFEKSPDRHEARRKLGWPLHRVTFVYVGTIGIAQGLDTLLSSASQLHRDPDLKVDIRVVGDGVERTGLQASAKAGGLDHVQFEESRPASEVPLVLAAADAALVLLRKASGDIALPTKLVEAMAAERPVIVSADGEARKLVESNGAGWAVPAEDPAALAGALREAASDLPVARQRGLNAGQLARTRFSRKATAAALRDVLRVASGGGQTTDPPRS